MNIDFIKYYVPYTEGFTLNGDQLIFPEGGIETLTEELLELPVWEKVWEPLFLQRAIEGVNKKYQPGANLKDLHMPYINNVPNFIEVYGDCASIQLEIGNNPEQAKEKALEYVREQVATP